jgi:signal transduction histidine kinase
MRKLWFRISNLGLEGETRLLHRKALILTNQLNFSMLIIMLFFVVYISIIRSINDTTMGMGSFRLLLVLIVNVVNLILSYFKKTHISKIVLLFLPALLIYVIPTLTGFVEQESFVYYPLTLIVFSIIPQLLLVNEDEKTLLFVSLAFYAFLLLAIEPFLILFSPSELTIVPLIKSFLMYSKLVQIMTLLFLHFAIFYLRNINRQFEQEIIRKNQALDRQNSELNKALQHLNETQQQLFQAEKMAAMGTLTKGVAHEINNPLNFIAGGLQLLEEELDAFRRSNTTVIVPDFRSSIRIMEEGIERTSRIVNALISLSGNGQSEKRPADIHELIDNTLLFMNHMIPQGLIIKKEYSLVNHVSIIKTGFQQAFLSVVENAIYAIESKKERQNEYIRIKSFSRKSDQDNSSVAVLEITNSGPLIPEEIIHRIFDPFFTTKDTGKGTGLGLTIAYSFVKEHGGTISAENRGEGVCFRITLPL